MFAKYVVLRVEHPNEAAREVPVLLPPFSHHADALWMYRTSPENVVSAGVVELNPDVEIILVDCHGSGDFGGELTVPSRGDVDAALLKDIFTKPRTS